jgi:protein-tyrosine phosphatase
MIDIHSHILYGMDDGAETIDDSVKMAEVYQELGFKKVYCSPHVMNFYYDNAKAAITEKCTKLQVELQARGLNLELVPFGEIYLDETVLPKLKEKVLPTIRGRVLVEGPFNEWPFYIEEILFKIKTFGLAPIMAHPERNRELQKDKGKLKSLKEEGCLLQGNISNMVGAYGSAAQKCFEVLLKDDLYDYLATDMHSWQHKQMYQEALDKTVDLIGQENVLALFGDV